MIALSASAASAAHREVSLDGFDVVLTKPVRFNELLDQIGRLPETELGVRSVRRHGSADGSRAAGTRNWDERFIANLGDLAMRGDVQALKHLCDEASRHSMKMRQLLAELAPHVSNFDTAAIRRVVATVRAVGSPERRPLNPTIGCGLPAIRGGLHRESSLPEPLLRPSAAA